MFSNASIAGSIPSVRFQFVCISIVSCGSQWWILHCYIKLGLKCKPWTQPWRCTEIVLSHSIEYEMSIGLLPIKFQRMFMPMEYYANQISIDSYYLTSKPKSSYFDGFLQFSKKWKIALDQLKHSGSIGPRLSSQFVILESWWIFMAPVRLWGCSYNTTKLVNMCESIEINNKLVPWIFTMTPISRIHYWV